MVLAHKVPSGHPGPYIRQTVLPADLSVTAAAKTLGVGRPALSNLLNGNASLSPEMATRIEKAFGASSEALLKMQADYDRSLAREKEPAIAVRSYAPSFMCIKAMQIEAWSERQEVRAELAAFLRRLVVSTGVELSKADFPAFENSQRKGWDGTVTAGSATPWIPLGNSGWEFGVNRDAARKAEEDYAARTKGVAAKVRADTTFVFVTPRNWAGKEAWAAAKRAKGEWRDVRAYNASDLEQWLEASIPAQAWMAEQLGIGAGEVQTLDACWKRWAGVTKPEFSKELFGSASQAHAETLSRWLQRPGERPLPVVADSADEALAALACLFENETVRQSKAADRVIVVRSADALAKVTSAATDFVVVMASADAERESAGIHRQHHAVIVTRRNALEDEADITFDLADHQTFETGLTAMGFDRDGVHRLARESGYSLTVLRRRLSEIPAIRTPPWAQQAIADRLIPLVFVGAWDSTSEADQAILSDIAAGSHDEIEKTVAELAALEQPPVWSIGKFRGVVSKVDAFYAVQSYVTAAHLKRLFQVARVVLSESDPALDLPEDKRWASNLYGKSRRHSAALRQGLCETLVLLSVHGDNLFKTRVGFDVEAGVNGLVRQLLTPLDPVTWQSQRHDLPRYAEAAPELFLDILEQDLCSADPKVHALMQPAESGMFSSPGRTGLLWALEVLAWNPLWLSRVVLILGKLAELKIADNWANKPDHSLASIFRCCIPQTAATVEERIAALELLIRRHPYVGWRICIDQFDPASTTGDYTSRPRWRRDAIGAGQGATGQDRLRMARKALDLAIAWPAHTDATLSDLVERMRGIPPEDQEAVWSAIEAWAGQGPDDARKAALRESIRRSTMTRRSRVQGVERKLRIRAKAAYDALQPADIVFRHQWLFGQQWVDESADELADEEFDYRKRDQRIAKMRENALREVWVQMGYDGIARLCGLSEAPWVIGGHLATGLFDEASAGEFIGKILAEDAARSLDQCLYGLLGRLNLQALHGILTRAVEAHLKNRTGAAGIVRLLTAAPFGSPTWQFVDLLPEAERQLYWREILPASFYGESDGDVNRAVDELLAVDRPRAAFHVVHMEFAKVASVRLVRLLFETATNNSEPKGHYQLSKHDISEAFKELTKRPDVMPDELARLEFLYIEALDRTEHGIRNLEKQLGQSPELFVQALALAFRRSDGGEDPPHLRPGNADSASGLAAAAYRLLTHARRVPGTSGEGKIDARRLGDWLTRVRELTREHAREAVGESIVGQLLGRCPVGEDGIWPTEAVRDVLEDYGTPELAGGMRNGRYNARDAGWRGEGGGEERTLAESYRTWSRQLANRYPFTSRMLNDMARMYDHDASWHDTDSKVRRRLET
jgi:addiction module HigA family antidote